MKLNLPGLLREPLPSGAVRWRVRVAGDKSRRIVMPVAPDHPEFLEIYRAARAGITVSPTARATDLAIRNSVGWLVAAYVEHLTDQVKKGTVSAATLKQRQHFFARLLDHKAAFGRAAGQPFRDLHMQIPPEELVALRDAYAATSGAADNMMASIRSMYRWACDDRRILSINPAIGISRIHRSQGGATAWTVADLHKFRDRHPLGTTPHLALTLFMFTAARVSDAILLGRANEVQKGSTTWLDWTPQKRNAARVRIPMMPPLQTALRARKIIGPTYLTTQYGKSWASTDSFRNQFKKWCQQADLPDLSPHGIRKAAGTLLAEWGASQYMIMAIHGHDNPNTSAIYTDQVNRDALAESGAALFANLNW